MQAQLTAQQAESIQASFFNKVYAWMCLALALTGFIAMRTVQSDALLNIIFGNQIVFFGLINCGARHCFLDEFCHRTY